eukprot:761194-Alexandrium_andersonii.AAC.1
MLLALGGADSAHVLSIIVGVLVGVLLFGRLLVGILAQCCQPATSVCSIGNAAHPTVECDKAGVGYVDI